MAREAPFRVLPSSASRDVSRPPRWDMRLIGPRTQRADDPGRPNEKRLWKLRAPEHDERGEEDDRRCAW